MDMKKREDLKDQLTEKFKGRFGSGGYKDSDECSVASAAIRNEVDKFAKTANVTDANLNRLERRMHARARGGAYGDDASAVSGVSAYTGLTGLSQAMSGLSKARCATSLAGSRIMGAQVKKHDWSKLDEYAAYLHEQDALRQKLGVQALQRKLKMDLDAQVNEKSKRHLQVEEEDRKYHENSLMELERWKQQEQERAEEKKAKVIQQKEDREEQLKYDRMLKEQSEQKKKQEESFLVEKIVTEMEADQHRHEKKKEQTKKAMKKVFEENAKDQAKKLVAEREAREKEAATMKEYNRILDEQEEQRAEELAERTERQAALMKKLQDSSEGQKKSVGNTDAKRAAAQQEEQDRHFFEAEAVKQNRLRQMRLENQAYLLKQMEEKAGRGSEDNYLTGIQAQILERDTAEYNVMEKQKVVDRRHRNVANRREIEKQMAFKAAQSVPEMSDQEVRINQPLLELVDRTLTTRDTNMAMASSMSQEGY